MRDAHRMKEKFDFSLDNRQIVSLLITSLVVLGTVFVLGVVVGKKLAGNAQSAAAPDLLTAIDQQTEAAPSLTFQEELTRKAEPPVEEKKAEVVAAPPPPPREETPVPKEEPVVQAAEAPAEGKVEPAPVATRIKDAGAKDSNAQKRPAEAAANGAFTLQLSATQSRVDADKFAARLRDQGYAPYITEATVSGRGTWYRVRMGSFTTKEAAQRYLQDFRRETKLEAFVAGGAN